MELRRAERKRQHLRIALAGPPGSGKTYTALRLAHGLGGPVGVIDTENGSSELYAGGPNPDGGTFDFAVIDLAQEPGKFSVDNYVKALRAMAAGGIRTVVVDSGSHAWAGPGGVLEYVDEVARRAKSGNKFTAWAEGTPKHNELMQALLTYPGHVLFTMRSKVEHVQEQVNGRTVIRKVGMAPVQRDGVEYEFTVTADLEQDTHRLVVTKSRCSALADKSFDKPGADVARVLLDWLGTAAADPVPPLSSPAVTSSGVVSEPGARASEGGPRWTPEQQRGFFAEYARVWADGRPEYESLADWCASLPNGKRPSVMTQAQRQKLLVALSSADKRVEIGEWLARRAEVAS